MSLKNLFKTYFFYAYSQTEWKINRKRQSNWADHYQFHGCF